MAISDTLTNLIRTMHERGYTVDLNEQLSLLLTDPAAFAIEAIYRFEGPTDPGDERVLYTVVSHKYALKGILTNANGIYGDLLIAEIEQQLSSSPDAPLLIGSNNNLPNLSTIFSLHNSH